MRVTCSNCGRYLLTAAGTVVITAIICPNSKCKLQQNIKIVSQDSSDADIRVKLPNPLAPKINGRTT